MAALSAQANSYRQEVGVGLMTVLNVKVGAAISSVPDPSLAPRSDRTYLDGYNRVDSSGNLGEGSPGLASRTGNFGFTSNSQVDLARGTLALHTLSAGDAPYFDRSARRGNIAPEIHYRILCVRPGRSTFGLEARAGRIDVNHSSTDSLAGSVRVLTDAYALGGVVPQPAPYAGSFMVQPGTQRIGDTPTRSITNAPATVQGGRSVTARGWLLRLGVAWRPVETSRFDLQFHAGPAMMNLEGDFRLNETWTSSGQPALSQAASGKRREWLAGGYAGVTGSVRLGRSAGLFAHADVLTADTLSIPGFGGRAKVNFSSGILLSAGTIYRF